MEVKIKKLSSNAVIPKYAKEGDAGLDLTATNMDIDKDGNICYGTGLAFEIPVGYVGLVFPRSSISRYEMLMTNSVGVIDSGYRGEVTAKFISTDKGLNKKYNIGDRIAQMIILPYPQIELIEVDKLSQTERGAGGYGSTGL